jgi:DNA-binding CsgD family transcriptional regulator
VALRVLKHFHAPVPANTAAQTATLLAASHVDENAMPQHLSQREVDVLRLIGKGYNAPEAARLLGISAHTTSSYIRDIYRKLGISSRAEAAMEAARRGLVG